MSFTPERLPGALRQSLLLLLLTGGCIRAPGPPHGASQGPDRPLPVGGTAGTLVGLPGLPGKSVLRAPSVAVDGDTVFVAANLFLLDSVVGPPAYIGRLHRTADGGLQPLDRLPLPPGEFQFAYPRILAGNGRLHLVWAELANRWSAYQEWATPANLATTLWHAVREGGTWSTPERIDSATVFAWNVDAGGAALEASRMLHVVAWKGDDGEVPRVVDYRWSEGHWEAARLPFTPGLNQATAVTAWGDTVTIAFVESVADPSRVLVVASRDHGQSWSAPHIASQRRPHQASIRRLGLAPAADRILLAIGEQPFHSSSLDTLRVVWLTRDLRRLGVRLVDLSATVDGFELAGGSCGAGILLLREFSSAPRLSTAILAGPDAVPVIRQVLPGSRTLFPAIGADEGWAVAAFAELPAAAPLRNVAMAIPLCPP